MVEEKLIYEFNIHTQARHSILELILRTTR